MTFGKSLILATAISFSGFAANAHDAAKTNLNFDIDSIEFIEEDSDLELGFDTSNYLPENFNPYHGTFTLSALNFMELCDEIELGFETSEYLPEGFTPFAE